MSEFGEFHAHITCPYCGHEEHDAWEYESLRDDGDETEIECGECERFFRVRMAIEVTYASAPEPAPHNPQDRKENER